MTGQPKQQGNEPRLKALQLKGQVNALKEMTDHIGGFAQLGFDREQAEDIEAQVELVIEANKAWQRALKQK